MNIYKLNIRRFKLIVIVAFILLLIPLIAMQFTNEVNWNLADFLVGGILLVSFGVLSDLVLRKTDKFKYRIVAFTLLFAVLALIWAELAVGIFGTVFAGN